MPLSLNQSKGFIEQSLAFSWVLTNKKVGSSKQYNTQYTKRKYELNYIRVTQKHCTWASYSNDTQINVHIFLENSSLQKIFNEYKCRNALRSCRGMIGWCSKIRTVHTWSFSWLRSVPPIKPGPMIPTARVVLERKNLEWAALRALTQSSCFNTTVILYSLHPWAIARTLMFACISYHRFINPVMEFPL